VLQLAAAGALLPAAAPRAASAAPGLTDGTLQAFADTLIPGRRVARTDLGFEVHPKAIAGAHSEPGAVQTDALALYHHPLIGFDLVAPAFLADLQARSLLRLGQFLDLSFEKRVAVCKEGLAPGNPTAQVWELAAAVPAAAFLCSAMQPNSTIDTSSGLQVMGHPGIAPNGYADYSYRQVLATERTATGSLP
jgi:hypothetical protein